MKRGISMKVLENESGAAPQNSLKTKSPQNVQKKRAGAGSEGNRSSGVQREVQAIGAEPADDEDWGMEATNFSSYPLR